MCNRTRFRRRSGCRIAAPSGEHTQFVQVTVKVGGIAENPEGTRSNQIVLAVAAVQHPRSHSEFQAQFRQQCVLPRTYMLVSGHDLLNRRIYLLLRAAGGESLGQQ